MTEIEAADLLSLLPERERLAIRNRYWHKKTLAAVGACLGVSREGARRVIIKGQKRLRALMFGEQRSLRSSARSRRKCRICRSLADEKAPWQKTEERLLSDRLQKDCLSFLAGKIKTQTEIAAKYGVTRACVSRRVCLARERQGIPPTPKQIVARKTYGLRQMIVMAALPRMTEKQKAIQQLWGEGPND